MSGVAPLAKVIAVGALVAASGCVRWTHLAPSELQIHGKAGQACSAVVTPLVWSVNAALFPVSVASLGRKPPSHDNLGYPGLAVENGAYFACATLALPLRALDRGTEAAYFLLAGREELEDHLIDRLPHLGRGDYSRLVRTARRTCPPAYDEAAPGVLPPGPGTASPREFGLWSTGRVPRYGSKPRVGNFLAAEEWRDWRAAGRPRGEDVETAFVVNRALGFADPALRFSATYGPARTPFFDREHAAQQARLAVFAADGDAAAVAVALQDPSPILRAAAVRRRAGAPDDAVGAELARFLEDEAVVVRAAAAAALASRADPKSAPALGRALGDADPLVRERAALALGTIGTPAAADMLLAALGTLGHRARFQALCSLADAGRPRTREALSRALTDSDLHTRIAAAAAIGQSAADPGDPLYLRALSDSDPRISEVAAHARERRGEVGAPGAPGARWSGE